MMTLNFTPISLDRQKEYRDLFAASLQHPSDYSFANLWGWAEEYGLRWAWSENLVWIKQTVPEELYWAPMGPWNEIHWNHIFDNHFKHQIIFIRVPESLMKTWKTGLTDKIIIEEERIHWDYLYSVAELIELKGKRFHKKKNLLNQFRKKYNFIYADFNPDLIDQALAMQEDWCTWRDCESSDALSAENRSIAKTLNNWEKLYGLMGGAIYSDGGIAAYTVAERLAEDTIVIHFEKGNQGYKGVYQAINQMFLDHSGRTFTWVNREQDLGDEGLRKAKLSYNPKGFLKKYRICI